MWLMRIGRGMTGRCRSNTAIRSVSISPPTCFSSSIGALYYTNVKEWIPAKDLEVLNPEYWDFSTRRIKLGSASLVKGLEYGLVNSRQNDSLLLFMTSDLVYGTENMGVVNPDQPVVWAVKIKKVVKP